MTFWRTAEERDAYAEKEIRTYLDDNEWFEEVEGVIAGVVTHSAQAVNIQKPQGSIDEDGYDEAGDGPWEDPDQVRCNYALMPLPPDPVQEGGERPPPTYSTRSPTAWRASMTDPNPAAPEPELWEVMVDAYMRGTQRGYGFGYAAEIEALADAVVPEEPEHRSDSAPDCPIWARWDQRREIRAVLLAAARRAREAQP